MTIKPASSIGDHLADGRLHVVAAPGAGKTILGLEIVRRLGRRALVFAPTVAIRDQWADRLTPLFLDEPPGAHEVSHQLSEPRFLTLATYQALDAFRRADEIERLANDLSAAGSLTLVLDEAHHLRREWWNGIEELTSSLADVQVVALTATPPYDATFAEWTRYEGVCGPIDLEIGIPELARNGDLCPHQDHVILSQPTHEGLKLLDERRRAIAQPQADLRADATLLDRLERHPWLQEPQAHAEAILEAPQVLSAVLLQLAGAGRRLPTAPLRLLGVSARDLPPPSFLWLETFLEGVRGSHAKVFDIGADRAKALRQRLHDTGWSKADASACSPRDRSSSSWRPTSPSWTASPTSPRRRTGRWANASGWWCCRITSERATYRRRPRPSSGLHAWVSCRSSSTCAGRASARDSLAC